MNLSEFNFKEVGVIDMAFPTLNTNHDLLREAIDRGFYNGNTKYNKLFSKLFFQGGGIKFKKDVDESFIKKAWPYCQCLMRSYSPKHEEKEAICAMIMSEILEA